MRVSPIEFEVFKNLFLSVAEEMGVTLRRTGFSPNIKERLDYSCAVYDAHGETIAQGDHMPVHLGAMPLSVRAAVDAGPMEAGDVVMLNDPFRGGTHLPDITLVAPVYVAGRGAGTSGGRNPPPATKPPGQEGPRPTSARFYLKPHFFFGSSGAHPDASGAY